MKSKIGKLGSNFRKERIERNFGALWDKQVPKDESHIPLILLMEEKCNFNGGIPSMDLQGSTMGFGEDGDFLGENFCE